MEWSLEKMKNDDHGDHIDEVLSLKLSTKINFITNDVWELDSDSLAYQLRR